MSDCSTQKYSADSHIAEIYDQVETQLDDVDLIVRLIGPSTGLTIFEPFCGTGRMLIPLARQGHRLTGLDESAAMLARLGAKLQAEPETVRNRVQLIHSSVFAAQWPAQVDVVLLGGNCCYEVSSSDEQKALIHRAAACLRRGGHVFIDNDDHPSVELAPGWRKPPGQPRRAFPSGTCQDGTRLEGSTETAWYDIHGRFTHYIRRLKVTHTDGSISHREWQETCHPIVLAEVLAAVKQAGLVVEQTFGDKQGNPYGPGSPRALVWACKS